MFSNISDFGYKRSALQAAGFYIVYLILTVITAAIAGMFFGAASGSSSFEMGQKIGMIVAILFVLFLSFLILQSKKLLGNYTYLLIAAGGGILAFFGGGLLGLIVTAYLTTVGTESKPKAKKKSKK